MKKTVVVFERDVKSSELKGLFENYDGDIVINGSLEIDDVGTTVCCGNIYTEKIDSYANSEMHIIGDIISLNICCVNLKVNGNLHSLGDFDANSLDIIGDIYVSGKMRVINLHNKGGIYATDVTLGR